MNSPDARPQASVNERFNLHERFAKRAENHSQGDEQSDDGHRQKVGIAEVHVASVGDAGMEVRLTET